MCVNLLVQVLELCANCLHVGGLASLTQPVLSTLFHLGIGRNELDDTCIQYLCAPYWCAHLSDTLLAALLLSCLALRFFPSCITVLSFLAAFTPPC